MRVCRRLIVVRTPLDQDDPDDVEDNRPQGWPWSVLTMAVLVGGLQVLWLCGVV